MEIPRDKLVVVTGLSGSGKSSLAFDTIYAEGNVAMWKVSQPMLASFWEIWRNLMWTRLMVWVLPSPLTRKQQAKTLVRRSERQQRLMTIFVFFYARVGVPYCPNGHGAIQSSSVEQIVDEVLALPERTRMQILAPIIRRRKGQHKAVLSVYKRTVMFVFV